MSLITSQPGGLSGVVGEEAAGAVEDGVAGGAGLPAEDAAGLVGGVAGAAAEGGGERAQGRVAEPGGEADGDVGDLAGGDLAAVGAEAVAQDAGHVPHPHELAGGQEALATGAVIARMWTSARSRTSTISRPIRGMPRIFPETIRPMMPTEPMLDVVRTGPNTAPGSTVASSVGPV
jgi:hypothetical protein